MHRRVAEDAEEDAEKKRRVCACLHLCSSVANDVLALRGDSGDGVDELAIGNLGEAVETEPLAFTPA